MLLTHKRSCSSQRAGKLMKQWKTALENDSSAHLVVAATGSKRKAVCFVAFRGFASTADRSPGC